MSEEKKFTKTHKLENETFYDEVASERSDAEGMSPATAKIVVDKHIKKRLMEEYDIQDFKDAGRYFVVKARSKDGKWFYELMVDKQSGHITVSEQKPLK